ncbi:hypothetical protein PIB30_019631 [Stylosanthes scabra]|uniref:Uncharacterized protein n=1 Tax=Stylosanthes scabra TaxID=79078 RepID=A0ABU6R8M0_9FABA|nr:hypothetical protein [Stylosanthes scabra]
MAINWRWSSGSSSSESSTFSSSLSWSTKLLLFMLPLLLVFQCRVQIAPNLVDIAKKPFSAVTAVESPPLVVVAVNSGQGGKQEEAVKAISENPFNQSSALSLPIQALKLENWK